MPSLLNPWVILGLVLALAGSYMGGHHAGYKAAWLEQQAEIARANEAARAREQAMTVQVNKLSAQLVKANQDAKAQLDNLRSDIGSGAVRLSVPTSGLYTCADPAAARGDRSEARAELDPAAAQDLVAIAADGDDAIRQLNACIDAYSQVRNDHATDPALHP